MPLKALMRLFILFQFTLIANCVESELVEALKILFNEINKPLQPVAITCWSVDASVRFVRSFSTSIQNYQINVFNDELFKFSNTDHCSDVFIVDIRCPNAQRIVNETNSLSPVNLRMVVVDSSMDVNDNMQEKMVDLFSNAAILPNSEIYLVTKVDNETFDFTQIYRTAINRPLIIEKFLPNSLRNEQDLTVISRRRLLNGIELRASMVVTNNDSLNHLDDYRDKHIDTITKVCYILTNHLISFLNASVRYSIVPSWGYMDADGEWSGMIGQLVKNEADLGATSLFFTADRVSVIQYIAMPSSTGSAFIFRAPKLSYTDNVFLLPFDDFVWLCLGCLVLVTAGCLLITVFVEWKTPLDGPCLDTDSGLLRPKLTDTFLLVFGATCQQGSSVTPRCHSARIITITAFVVLMFLYTSYAANIVALLQSPSTKIKSLKDLLDSRLKFGVDDTVFNHYYFSHATEPVRKKIYEQKVRNKDGSENFMNLETGIENVRKGLFAFHTESGVGYKIIGETFYEDEKCGLREIKYLDVIDPWYAIQKNSSYMELFKTGLMRINEHGLQERENSRLYTSKPKCSGGGGHFVTASLVDTFPAMLVLLYGYAIALILLISEILVKRFSSSYKSKNPLFIRRR
ncbi:Ionotropic receptor 75a [Pseudolycoriella hygida]|uniref:Ionotropic receptor 75a n=2 Tax=Pseudolycoriella hygida TaxID=35572 RepID=A0A9Q0N5A7_9DIPT|nr:Ionotropic receptor 75a [Pseudolycoriella hygida]